MSKIKVNNLETHTGDDITVHDNMHVLSANLSADGNVHVGGNLNVEGTSTLKGGTISLGDEPTDNVIFGADVQSNILPDADNTYNLGSADATWKEAHVNTLKVESANITGDLDLDGGLDVALTATVSGATVLKSTLDVTGVGTFTAESVHDGGIDVNGDADVSGTATVSGATVLKSTLDVTGVGTFTAESVHDGGIDVNGDADVSGTTNLQDTLDVDGLTTIKNVFEVETSAAEGSKNRFTVTPGASGDNGTVEIKSQNQDTRIYLEGSGDSYMETGTFTIGDSVGSGEKLTIVGNASATGDIYATNIEAITIAATSITADDATFGNTSISFDSGATITSNTNKDVIINCDTGGALISPLLSTAPASGDMCNCSQVAWLSSDSISSYNYVIDILACDGALLRSINGGQPGILVAAPYVIPLAQQSIYTSVSSTAVQEGEVAYATLYRSASAGSISVDYWTTDDTATAGTDYTAVPITTATFTSGVTSISVSAQTLTDGDFTEDDDETFTFDISGASLVSGPAGMVAPILGSPTSHIAHITDMDLFPNQSIQFTSPSQSIAEPAFPGSYIGSAEVNRTGDNPGYGKVYVNYVVTASGGTAGVFDFLPAAGTVTFDPTVTSQTIYFTISGDEVAGEPDETFNTMLQAPPVVGEHVKYLYEHRSTTSQ